MMIFEMLHLYTTCTVISMKAFTETSTKTIFYNNYFIACYM